MAWFLQLPQAATLLTLLLMFSPIPKQVSSLHIRPHECYNTMGDLGTCMFVWECIKTEGTHLGTCADGFLFGSCCAHNDSKNDIFPLAATSEKPVHETYSYSSTSATTKVSTFPVAANLSTVSPPTITITYTPHYSKLKPPYFKPLTTSNFVIPRPTAKSSTASNHLLSRPTANIPTILNHLIQKSTDKPSTASNHLITRSTTEPSSEGIPLTINRPQHPHVVTFPSSTSKIPHRPTTNKYGYFSSVQSWLYTSSFHSSFTSPKTPVKVTTPRPPLVAYWTPKYPFTRPSWKPITSEPVSATTPSYEPILFTYSVSHNTTRPSFTPFTSKVPHVSVSPNFTPSLVISERNFTLEGLSGVSENGIKHSIETFVNVTPHLHSTTTSFSFGYVSSTTPRPLVPILTENKPLEGTTQTNWFYPMKQKSTLSPTIPGEKDSVFFVSNSVPESFLTETSTIFQVPPLLAFDPVTSITVKSTTALPVTPCGIPTPHPQKKVVGGRNSAFGSWPWQASIRRTSFFGFSSTHRCGGALISRQWVATAGHCVDDLLLSQIKIRVGEYDFASVQEPYGYVERGARKKVVHPKYNFFTYENDLALVQLEEAIDSTRHPHISPICLPPTEENLVGRNATVTGWGRLSEGGVLPSILQEVQVPIISNEKCKNMFLAAGRHEYIPDIFMCAGFEDGGKDSCQGDSGGPLQIQTDEGYWFLAGIISWGIGCAEPNMPGVCTRISKFKEWIVQQISH